MSGQPIADPATTADDGPGGSGRPPSGGLWGLVRSESLTTLTPLLLGIIGVSIYATSASDFFLTSNNAQNIVTQILVVSVLAAGQTPLLVGGQLDLSVGSGVSLASIVGAMMLTNGWNTASTLVVVVLLFAAIGTVTGLVVGTTRVQPFILTLGLLSVLVAVANLLSDNRQIPTGLDFGGFIFTDVAGVPLGGVCALGVYVVLGLGLRFTRYGRFVFALGSNEEAAYLAGVPILATKVVLYTVNGLCVGFAGILLIARLGGGNPSGGSGLELIAITAAVLGGASLMGGRGSMLGTVLGVLLIGLISAALNITGVQQAYLQLIYGAILIASVVYSASIVRLATSFGRRRARRNNPAAG